MPGARRRPRPPRVRCAQVAYLKASNPSEDAHFACGGTLTGHAGNSSAVSADGTTIAVGAPHESSGAKGINGNQNDKSAYSSGAVYVFTRRGTAVTQQAYIKASNPGDGANFGSSVALSRDGNTLAVAAYYESSNATGINGNQADRSIPEAGAVYIFTRTGSTWSQQAYIKASNTGNAAVGENFAEGDQFGYSIGLSDDGNTLAVGAIGEDSNATGVNGDQADNSANQSGAAYVFTRTAGTWSQQAYIKSAMTRPNVLFGYSIGVSENGDTLAVAEYDADRGQGALYVLTRSGGAWTHQARIKADNAENGDSLGYSMAISDDGNTIAAGAADEDCLIPGINRGGLRQGPAHGQFVRGRVRVRAQRDHVDPAGVPQVVEPGEAGLVWRAHRDQRRRQHGGCRGAERRQRVEGHQRQAGRQHRAEAGAVYYYTRTGTTWTQQAYVKASNTRAGDEFGSSLALSGDGRTLLVGARGEDSGAKGINGNQADSSTRDAGAAYLFVR